MTKHGYYDEEGHLKYVLTSKELTELAQEVAAEIVGLPAESLSAQGVKEGVKTVLQERGIAWCDDE